MDPDKMGTYALYHERHEPLVDFLFTYAGVQKPYPWSSTSLTGLAMIKMPAFARRPTGPIQEKDLLGPHRIPPPPEHLDHANRHPWYLIACRNPAIGWWLHNNPNLLPPTRWPAPLAALLRAQGIGFVRPNWVANDWIPYNNASSAYSPWYNLHPVAHIGLGALQAVSLGFPWDLIPPKTKDAMKLTVATVPLLPTFWLWARPWPLATVLSICRARLGSQSDRDEVQNEWLLNPLGLTRSKITSVLSKQHRSDVFLSTVPALPWYPRSTVTRYTDHLRAERSKKHE